ncbi:hypothetical protein Ait01nite_067050 [Actinoplanes italicus]|uniref:EAL domain-containing protein (Putative c-di-GMP-specific phosphodiesterase class I) n=1 Tax=Actinoplanes italicus TaxID=113567 RepID=A0A2T0K0Y2_9ACTN|nr:EAL domain-containing protein [Actinoplanes italicus]PRX16454.1 EAL domain-containing protein (putative c-di-GMP-specific phosphodiesterase class I) [Actinoplanes italicus]GIE33660.1 hypothetical protein Ait01nite_067050 [Actinoplanes italicus]
MSTSTAHDVTTPVDPEIDRLLALARLHLGMEVAWLSAFTEGEQVIVAADGETAAMNVELMTGTALDGSFCTRVLAGTLPEVVTDARSHPVTRDLAVTRDLNIGSYVGAPWHGADGTVLGMLCCLSRHADQRLTEQDARFVRMLADLISDHLSSPAALARHLTRRSEASVREVLQAGAVHTVFQPIVSLRTGAPVAFEALSRFDPMVFATPDRAFAAAARCGLGAELELLAVRRALEILDRLPPGIRLNLNLSPEVLTAAGTERLLLDHAGHDLGVEITEHAQVYDYPGLLAHTRALQAAGVQILVDDAGAGFASLSHILRLRPDIIKLDISLVRDIDTDLVRQTMARSLNMFATETGAALIAEGIETATELDTLRGIGVAYGQGYLFGLPGPVPST